MIYRYTFQLPFGYTYINNGIYYWIFNSYIYKHLRNNIMITTKINICFIKIITF